MFNSSRRTIWTFGMGLVLVSALFILVSMLYRLENVEDSLIDDAFLNQEKEIKARLDQFFQPVTELLDTYIQMGELGGFQTMNIKKFNTTFVPVIRNSRLISSIMLTSRNGEEFMVLEVGDTIFNRLTMTNDGKLESVFYTWDFKDEKMELIDQKYEAAGYNPTERPWFLGAMTGSSDANFWTQPYTFYTTRDPGITVSRQWTDGFGDTNILAFDVLLNDISAITGNMNLDKNGKVFILSEDKRLLGCPEDIRYSSSDSLKKDLLTPISEVPLLFCQSISTAWDKIQSGNHGFKVLVNNDEWICKIRKYEFDNLYLYIGQAALMADFNGKLKRTRFLMMGGLLLIVLFLISLVWAYRNQQKAYSMLQKRRHLLELYSTKLQQQRDEIQYVHGNMVQSIRYARRIQKAILPPREILKRIFPNSFVYFRPRDMVSGDFYWFTTNDNMHIIAVADCTGHGVPGALMSMLGYSYLEELTEQQHQYDPAMILNQLREKVIYSMRQSENGSQRDGMDIAMLAFEKDMSHVIYAGAKNPLYFVRDGKLEIVRGNAMSISFEMNNRNSFRNHEINLKKGDTLYIFSDGFVDQFGGPADRKYLSSRFREFLLSIQNLSMEAQKSRVHKELMSWMGDSDQIDDICVIGVRV